MRRAEDILGERARAGRWSTIVTITPEQARALLEEQPAQRPVNDRHVDMLKSEMENGRFYLTHQGIAFDESGVNFDGQHRLWACFLSGVPITVWVFFNEPRGNFDIVDTRHHPRTVGQLAVTKGQFASLGHANAASAAGRFIHFYDRRRNPTTPNATLPFTSRELDAVIGTHPGLPAAAVFWRDNQAARRVRLPAASTIALFTLFAEADGAKAAIFQHQVLTGENLREGDPAMTLRNSAADSPAVSRGRSIDIPYRIARAWNAFHAGRTILKLYGASTGRGTKLRKDGLDQFPEIAGYLRPAER
jgi:hypothetical protein